MAVTNQKSTQVSNKDEAPAVMNPAYEDGGRVRIKFFEHTQDGAGDATSTVDLVELPAGKLRVLGPLSYIEWEAFGASRTFDIGYKAHTDSDGTAVSADTSALDAAIDVSSAGSAYMGSDVTAALGKSIELDSRDGVTIVGTVAGGTIPDTTQLTGWVAYVQD